MKGAFDSPLSDAPACVLCPSVCAPLPPFPLLLLRWSAAVRPAAILVGSTPFCCCWEVARATQEGRRLADGFAFACSCGCCYSASQRRCAYPPSTVPFVFERSRFCPVQSCAKQAASDCRATAENRHRRATKGAQRVQKPSSALLSGVAISRPTRLVTIRSDAERQTRAETCSFQALRTVTPLISLPATPFQFFLGSLLRMELARHRVCRSSSEHCRVMSLCSHFHRCFQDSEQCYRRDWINCA
jgi:hypothetical protein